MEPKEHFMPSTQIALFKLAPEKLAFSKIPPSRFASYKFVLINEDSTKLPLANVEFIITPLSKVTLIKLIKDRLEFGMYALLKSWPSENWQFE